MQVNKINSSYNNKNNKTRQIKNPRISILSFLGTPRVSKEMSRFYDVNKDKMPITLRTFLDRFTDKLVFSPLEAQK